MEGTIGEIIVIGVATAFGFSSKWLMSIAAKRLNKTTQDIKNDQDR